MRITYETLVIMKKKQFTSKLQFQKTTIVSFKAMKNIKGGNLVNVNTILVSVNGYTCIGTTLLNCHTYDDKQTCISCTDNECTRPTTRPTTTSVDCGAGDDTKIGCLDTRGC